MATFSKATVFGKAYNIRAHTSKNGRDYMTFSVGVHKKIDGGKQYATTYYEVVVYGMLCETARKIEEKDEILVMGNLNITHYVNKEMITVIKPSIIADSINIITKKTQQEDENYAAWKASNQVESFNTEDLGAF